MCAFVRTPILHLACSSFTSQEARGVEVSAFKFSGSTHCQHYRRHPHEYSMQISQFLGRALRDWS